MAKTPMNKDVRPRLRKSIPRTSSSDKLRDKLSQLYSELVDIAGSAPEVLMQSFIRLNSGVSGYNIFRFVTANYANGEYTFEFVRVTNASVLSVTPMANTWWDSMSYMIGSTSAKTMLIEAYHYFGINANNGVQDVSATASAPEVLELWY